MNCLPAPRVERWGKVWVVRDDLIPGGTKRRALPALMETLGGKEFVYASPAYGYAQVALAYTCRDCGYKATIFTAARKVLHHHTIEAQSVGAKVVQVPFGYLSNVQAKARQYCNTTGASLIPFGMDHLKFRMELISVVEGMGISPPEVWAVAGSGTLIRCLRMAWPSVKFFAVAVGKEPLVGGNTEVLQAPEKYEAPAKYPPPFPSCLNYDAKAWRFVQDRAADGALLWNVAG